VHGARPGNFEDCFYFSVQTLATIGYGEMTPGSRYANILVCLESFSGLMSQAVITGLTFAKFSVPTSHVLFSNFMTISKKDGRPALSFRLANARGNHVLDARCTLTLIRNEVTLEGEWLRRIHRLPLLVSETPVFALSFTGTHYLDQDSPLAGWDAAAIEEASCEWTVTMTGLDETLGQTVHARWSYYPEDIRWGFRLADTMLVREDGQRVLDFTKFHDVVPWPL